MKNYKKTVSIIFFINEPDWETQITQRNETLLQVMMDRCKMAPLTNKKTKKPKI